MSKQKIANILMSLLMLAAIDIATAATDSTSVGTITISPAIPTVTVSTSSNWYGSNNGQTVQASWYGFPGAGGGASTSGWQFGQCPTIGGLGYVLTGMGYYAMIVTGYGVEQFSPVCNAMKYSYK